MRNVFALSFLLLVLLAVNTACRENAPASHPVSLDILYTGNVNGELERCGCSEKQFGGVARRKTIIDRYRSENTLLLDSGDIFFDAFENLVGSREYYRYKSAAMIDAMNRMQYDAALFGDYDFAQGQAFLLERTHQASFPFVCANVIDAKGASPVLPYTMVTRGGLRIALVGFLDAHVVTSAYREALGDFQIQDPFQTAERIIPELQTKSDLIIALLHFNIVDTAEFLKTFPQIHVAILGHSVGEGSPEQVGQTITVTGGHLGKELGRLHLTVKPGQGVIAFNGSLIPIPEETLLDSGVQEVVTRFKTSVRERRFSEDVSFRSGRSDQKSIVYVGAKRCAPCHPVIFQRWSASPHAYAFDTLKERGDAFNPECVFCHVVGYRDPNGFSGENKTSHLMGVQCESCHGSGERHLLGEPMKSGVPEEVCRICHTDVHSPAFEMPSYFRRSNQCTLNSH